MRTSLAVSLAAVAIVGISLVAGIAYLPLESTTTLGQTGTSAISTHGNTTTSYVDNLPTNAETTNSTLGLKLVLSLNSTVMQSGQAINVTASIFNTLPTTNNVSGANIWAIPSLSYATSFPCPTYLYYQVFQGWYSTSNISESGMPLQVSPVYQVLTCPLFQRSYYLFHPYSDTASIPIGFSDTNSSTLYQDAQMMATGSLTGNYSRAYNTSIFTPNGVLPPPPFRPGIYTIVAGDEWDQIALSHFEVTPHFMFTTTANEGSTTFYQTSNACTISAEPTGFYLHVISDGTPKPIQGAKLTSTLVSECDGTNSTLGNGQGFTTNSTGWVTVSMPYIPPSNYFLVFNVEYSNSTYSFSKTFNVYWAPMQGTFVTVSLPSGTVSVAYRQPISCSGVCYYWNVPQIVTVVQSNPSITYTVHIGTNNTLVPLGDITNISLLTPPSNRTQVIRFYVTKPSYVFTGPSYPIIPNSNGSLFYLTYPNGTYVPTAFDSAGNLLYSTIQVQGWVEVNIAPA